jgi:hypothetical protein
LLQALSLDQAWEFARVVVEAGEDGLQVGNANVADEDFAAGGSFRIAIRESPRIGSN